MERRRIRLTVCYDGRDFAGSQIQAGKRTVAGTLKAELESQLGEPIRLDFASRTDRGVHADGNVCALTAAPKFPSEKFPQVLNPRLPWDLKIRSGADAAAGFSPRFDAVARTYVYRIYRGLHVPIDRQRYVAAYEGNWDGEQVNRALRSLLGSHSFAAFGKTSDAAEACICRMQTSRSSEHGAEVWWTFTANRFLRHMIVRLAGALLEVASGRLAPEALEQALTGQQNFKLRPAPAQGLTLIGVEYPKRD